MSDSLIKSGFFNGEDREYDARDMAEIFEGLIYDGVYMSVGDQFKVTPNSDMSFFIGTGRAWLDNTYTKNPSVWPLGGVVGDPSFDRIDLIVIDVDNTDEVRNNDVIYIKGVPSATPVAPTLLNEPNHKQYAISEILVPQGATTADECTIYTRIGVEGGTPFVTGIIDRIGTADWIAWTEAQKNVWLTWLAAEQASIEADKIAFENHLTTVTEGLDTQVRELSTYVAGLKTAAEADYTEFTGFLATKLDEFEQSFNTWFDAFKIGATTDMDTWTTSFQDDMTAWEVAEKADFDAWFANIQGQLSGDVATNLQNQITEVRAIANAADAKAVQAKALSEAASISATTAKNTADSAINAASTAQATANAANTTAGTALVNASNAGTLATQAKAKAELVETNLAMNYDMSIEVDAKINTAIDNAITIALGADYTSEVI